MLGWDTGRSLKLRMAVTVVVVVVLPIVFVYVLGSIPLVALEITTWFIGDYSYAGPLLVGLPPTVVAGAVAAGLVGQFVVGPRLALYMEDARRVDPDRYPRLQGATRRMAQQYDVPEPDLAVVDSRAPNAFVVGRSSGGSTLTVTQGLLDELDDDELDAVVAHELAHVKNRDVALMSVAYLLPTVTYVVSVVAYKVLGVIGDAGAYLDDDDAWPIFVFILVTTVLTLAVSMLFWLGSFLLFRVFSRYREYAADRAAAKATGDPLSLASALSSIDEGMTDAPDRDLRQIDGGAESMFVVPVDAPHLTEDRTLLNEDLFPATHPPTDERIDHLQEIAGDQETR